MSLAAFKPLHRTGWPIRQELTNTRIIILLPYAISKEADIYQTQVLKDHLIKGYSINEKRLKEQNERLVELQETVNLMGRVIQGRELDRTEAAGFPVPENL